MSALRKTEVSMVEGEFVFTQRDFTLIAGILYEDSGIHLIEAKAPLVYSRLAKRLRQLGLTRFSEYCQLLQGPEGAGERAALLSALTTNVTRFFRESHHFDALRQQVAESLAPIARAGGRVRLWSAGCSNGHEPYSMAMVLLAELPEAADLDVRILATDIDPLVVDRARAGVDSVDDDEPVPRALASRFVVNEDGGVRMADSLRRLVSFGVLNLHAEWPMKGRFDAIFCRNVAIYFDDETQRRLWSRFARSLTPDGRLYIGHSERAEVPELLSDGLTIYRGCRS
ncbi:MAG: protein-glutamate O-methyltransferase [Phenylobacterium sp.]|nr:protein-glutamate O-methyltransferase [Phenylobacterium sp.]